MKYNIPLNMIKRSTAATAADTASDGHHGKPLGGILWGNTLLGEPPSQVTDLDLCGGEERLL